MPELGPVTLGFAAVGGEVVGGRPALAMPNGQQISP